jgi:glycerophosphoryl diester phosphodiesterase
MAWRMGADMVAVDVARTADNAIVLFPDRDLACRTQASGPVSGSTLAAIKTLDPGYRFSADGRAFPLRGPQTGTIPTLEDAFRAASGVAYLFRLTADDPADAEVLVATLKRLGRDPGALGDGFAGTPRQLETIRRAFPHAWAWNPEGARACAQRYRLIGWTSLVPAQCRGGTMAIPIGSSLTMWGWPNRLLARLKANGAHAIALVDLDSGAGLTHARQLGDIAQSFTGYVLVDDYWTVGPAIRPDRDQRTNAEAIAAQNRDEAGS